MRLWCIRGSGTLFAALLGTTACGDVVGPGPEVELEVTLSQALVVPGENVTISIAVFNPGEHDVSLGDRCPPLGFRVIDEDGRRVGPAFNWESSFVCLGEVINTVPAGESIVYAFLWSPYVDYGSSNTPLPPGMYRIYAGFAGEPLRPPFSDRVAIQVDAIPR
jgi:hypothetical protein